MLTVVKPSAWTFKTSSSGGIGVEFVSAEGGVLYFKDPQGTTVSFGYGAAGAGLAAGFKLPKIGKLAVNVSGKSVVGAVAPAAFPNAGKLYVLDTCPDSDLTVSDIRGVCLFGEIGGGLVVGGSATAMVLGMNPGWLYALALDPMLAPVLEFQMLQSATAILLMSGMNAGVQAGGGGGLILGGIW